MRLWEHTKNKKEAFLTGGLLFLLYLVIFCFSGQDGETSGEISGSVSQYGVYLLNELSGGHMSQSRMDVLSAYWDNPIRKMAHFGEYACMGILVHRLLFFLHNQLLRPRLFWYSLLWVFLSAALDEFHQYFVPGRWACFQDVLLDTCGGACGALIGIWILNFSKKRRVQA